MYQFVDKSLKIYEYMLGMRLFHYTIYKNVIETISISLFSRMAYPQKHLTVVILFLSKMYLW